MELHNGGEIEIGEFIFIFWPVELLNKNNEDYEIFDKFSNIFLFGSDGGGSGFGFNIDSGKFEIISIELIGSGPEDIQIFSNSFMDLLKGNFI